MKSMLHDFDRRFTKMIQAWPKGMNFLMLIATLIGQPIFTVGTGTLIMGIGWGAPSTRLFEAGAVAVAIVGISTLAKLFFRRGRPLTEYVARMRFDTFSMPSGHGAGAVTSYGLVAYIAWLGLASPWGLIVSGLLALFITLIGVSRVYLGAHYPSDVIAGWLLGLVGLGAIIFIVQPVV